MDELDQSLDIIQDDQRKVRLVCILKNLDDLLYLLVLANSNKVLRSDEFDKRKVTLKSQFGRKSRLSTSLLPVNQECE